MTSFNAPARLCWSVRTSHDFGQTCREAIEILETQVFDAVMLDLTMPVMSGKEAFLEIHQRWPELPVAICTGYSVDVNQWLASPVTLRPTSCKSRTLWLNSSIF